MIYDFCVYILRGREILRGFCGWVTHLVIGLGFIPSSTEWRKYQ